MAWRTSESMANSVEGEQITTWPSRASSNTSRQCSWMKAYTPSLGMNMSTYPTVVAASR